jgi:hypothetical protein
MKFVEPSHFADPDTAARKLVEIADAVEAVQDGRIYIERVNSPFLEQGGTPDQYRAALARAIKLGWLWRTSSRDRSAKPRGFSKQ